MRILAVLVIAMSLLAVVPETSAHAEPGGRPCHGEPGHMHRHCRPGTILLDDLLAVEGMPTPQLLA